MFMHHLGVSCHQCITAISDERRKALEERQRQIELAEKRRSGPHIGARYVPPPRKGAKTKAAAEGEEGVPVDSPGPQSQFAA